MGADVLTIMASLLLLPSPSIVRVGYTKSLLALYISVGYTRSDSVWAGSSVTSGNMVGARVGPEVGTQVCVRVGDRVGASVGNWHQGRWRRCCSVYCLALLRGTPAGT